MSAAKKNPELRLSGSRLGARFSMLMSLALALVMIGAGLFLYNRTSKVAARIQEKSFVDAVEIQGPLQAQYLEELRKEYAGIARGKTLESAMPIKDREVRTFADGAVVRKEVMYGEGFTKHGYMYQFKDVIPPLIVPMSSIEDVGEGLPTLIIGVTLCVILVGAFVALMVGNAVSRPLETIVDDIAQISRGDLRHRTRVRAGGEIMLLAKSIDRMAGNLEEAQAAQLELSVREREIALAGEVREALLPESTPVMPGYDLGALHVASPTPGGDFHDFIESGSSVGLLVCEVSGRGIPGALIGAIARSYLRVELERERDVAAALERVNRGLARDVRRGMYVTALYVLVEPGSGHATVACAGHKLALIRYSAADKKIRLVQPEGIALGFDKGPVFGRTLQIQRVPLEVGDRLLLANTGPVRVRNAAGEELGEKAFYRHVLSYASESTPDMLAKLQSTLEQYAGGEPFPNDISIVSIARKA
jgi:serine phosphatase RsbU (regulator of sigma subunit)